MPSAVLPYIPEYITVHLGKPDQEAQNVQVRFIDYIKNVASSEIYPTWPEESLRANIYVIITYALNRIYTEWYKSKGYDFEITNTTQFDQAFVPRRDIFDNISLIVDEIFNDYVVKQGSVAPYFTAFCNGTTSTCDGLSQWGTVDLAKQGYTPYAILQNYYGNDINIVPNAPVRNIEESYPGTPLKLGMSSNEVKIIQAQLNRIRKNYPAISKINQVNGDFRDDTEKAVKDFQGVFNLTPDGIVGKATWYKIKNLYNGVKQLSELSSEGIKLEEVERVYPVIVSEGMTGDQVKVIQYYLNVIGYFNELIPLVDIDGYYGPKTKQSVTAFQKSYGLPPDGMVGRRTWNKMNSIYLELVNALPAGYEGEKAELYPGYNLEKGMRDRNVNDLQTYLRLIADSDMSIPKTSVTGYFGDVTRSAVIAFQKKYGLNPNGIVNALTWDKIAQVYNELKGL